MPKVLVKGKVKHLKYDKKGLAMAQKLKKKGLSVKYN